MPAPPEKAGLDTVIPLSGLACISLYTSLLRLRWRDLEGEAPVELLPLLCDPDLEKVRQTLRARLTKTDA